MKKRIWSMVPLLGLLTGWGCNSKPNATVTSAEQLNAIAPAEDADLKGPDLFEDITSSSKVNFTYRNGEEVPHLAILESLGGGVALIDYNGDGLLDLFFPGGGYYDGADKKEIKGHSCKLFKNLGKGVFKDVTAEVGLDHLANNQPWFYTHGAAVGDYDRDGWPDLLVTGWGRVALFRNVDDGNGGRRFEDVSKKAHLDTGITWATSAAWADFDGDGYPDLYICQYVNWSFANHPSCDYDGKTPDVCPPKKFQGLPHKVYLNDGKGGFKDVSEEAGLNKGGDGSKGLGVVVVDVNHDGKPDVYVANDTVDNFLYINHSTPGNIRFKEGALLAGVARDGSGKANGSMGVDAGDPDGSGFPSLWVTTYEKELPAMFRNMGRNDGAFFLFNSPASGMATIGKSFVGWGTGFFDIDHHGWEDVFIANGHAIRFPANGDRRQKPILMRNWNGKFKDISKRGGSYFQKPHLSRGVALGDLDNDGKIDLVICHTNEPIAILRNIAPVDGNHWLGVKLVGKDHADVVGARIIATVAGHPQTRFAKGGGSYLSSSDRRHVFGLGANTSIDSLTVVWPDGSEQEWTHLAPDRYHRLTYDKSKANKK